MMITCYVLTGICLIASLVTAMAYTNRRKYISPTAKLVASACFILIALFCNFTNDNSGSYGMMIFAALVCGLVGDILLMVKEFFEGKDSVYFLVMGILAFAIGHIIYTARFIMLADHFRFWLLPILAITPILMITMMRLGMLKIGKLAPVMFAYSGILGMTFMATLNLVLDTHSQLSYLVLAASLSFLLSDAALCMDYFGHESLRRVTNYVVMPFYFMAQVLFAFSIALV